MLFIKHCFLFNVENCIKDLPLIIYSIFQLASANRCGTDAEENAADNEVEEDIEDVSKLYKFWMRSYVEII